MKYAILFLFALTVTFTACRTSKVHKSTEVSTKDSAGKSLSVSTKETFTRERHIDSLDYKVGDLHAAASMSDPMPQPFETEDFLLTATANPGTGKMDLKLQGKKKKIASPADKETYTKEETKAAASSQVSATQKTTTKDKTSSGIPFYGWLLIGFVVLFILICIGYVIKRQFFKP